MTTSLDDLLSALDDEVNEFDIESPRKPEALPPATLATLGASSGVGFSSSVRPPLNNSSQPAFGAGSGLGSSFSALRSGLSSKPTPASSSSSSSSAISPSAPATIPTLTATLSSSTSSTSFTSSFQAQPTPPVNSSVYSRSSSANSSYGLSSSTSSSSSAFSTFPSSTSFSSLDDLLQEVNDAVTEHATPTPLSTSSLRATGYTKSTSHTPTPTITTSSASNIGSSGSSRMATAPSSSSSSSSSLSFTPLPGYTSASAPSTSSFSLAGAAAATAKETRATPCLPLILHNKASPDFGGGGVCTHLRCTQCAHHVIALHGRAWSADVDYFFFRNNVPDRTKLELGGTTPDPSASAYCCQCAWRTVRSPENLTVALAAGKTPYNQEGEASLTQLRWMCLGR